MATLAEVAARSHVTVTTISRMLNNKGNVSEKTRKKILEAMRELDYQPNEIARSMTKKISNFIGLIVPTARNLFFARVIDEIEKNTVQYGYKLLLCTSNHEEQKEIEYCRMLRANKVAGIIIASRTEHIWEKYSLEAPIISIERVISPSIPAVCSDNLNGGVLAARHLLKGGCVRPAYFSGSADLNMDANKRYVGFRNELALHGVEPVIQDFTEERFISMQYEDIIADFFARYPDIDGVFTSNDIIAAQVIRFAGQHGVAVPERLRVIGYDDVDMAMFCSPSITTIRQPVADICRFTVDCIAGYHNGKAIPSNTVFPVQLIPRESA